MSAVPAGVPCRPRGLAAALTAVLLLGPTAVAFFAGGFFDRGRLVAGLVALLVLALVALTAPRPLPRTAAARATIGGLALLTAVTALSAAWAPLKGHAFDDAQRIVLYLAGLVAAAALLQARPLARAVLPAIAFGGLVVILYALSERVLPDLVELSRSSSAAGRLEQPLTYWNAVGALAALSLTACAGLAGDGSRSARLRAAAAAAAVPVGAGLFLTFSRGALAGAALGFVLLLLLQPSRPQLRGLAVCAAGAVLTAALIAPLPDLRDVTLPAGASRAQGAVALLVMLVMAAVAGALSAWLARAERSGKAGAGSLGIPRLGIALIAAAALAVVGGAFALTGAESNSPVKQASAQRLSSVESIRLSYWDVALGSFVAHPLEGVGSGGFIAEWNRERDVREPAKDAHSLYLETASELGLLGLAALGLFLGGLLVCALRALRADPSLAVGPCAVLGVWAVVCALDWHWEMPAVTLPALLAAAVLVARADQTRAEVMSA